MNKFRETEPNKRVITTAVTSYQEHKDDLIIDFHNSCGYCDDNDIWRNAFYEIDHFIPKDYLENKEHTDYSNLVYSCRYCNNSKRKKWPTGDRNIPNDGVVGFERPWTKEYSDLFKRDFKGNIVSDSDLGNWIIKNLNLGLKRHSIIWQLEKIDRTLDELEKVYPMLQNNVTKEKITMLLFLFRSKLKELQHT
jgi:hypothetical protein